MKPKEFYKLSKEQQKEEIEKCQSLEYFYNNYCKKEGMPEYSEETWQEYIEANKKERFSRRRGIEFNFTYPFTPEEAYKNSIEKK